MLWEGEEGGEKEGPVLIHLMISQRVLCKSMS